MQETLSCVLNVLCTQDVRYTPRGPGKCASLRASRNDGRLRERRLLLPHHSGLWILQSCQAHVQDSGRLLIWKTVHGWSPVASVVNDCARPAHARVEPRCTAPQHNVVVSSVRASGRSLSGRFSRVSCMALSGTALAGNCSWCTSLRTGNVKPLVLYLVRIAASLRCSH
jgi:hypothetical protein